MLEGERNNSVSDCLGHMTVQTIPAAQQFLFLTFHTVLYHKPHNSGTGPSGMGSAHREDLEQVYLNCFFDAPESRSYES